MTLAVVGIGEPLAGDDGVAFRVIERLRERRLSRPVTLRALRDPSGLWELLGSSAAPAGKPIVRVLLVDAVLDPAHEGRVRLLGPAAFARDDSRPISSHGISALTAVELARAVHGEGFPELQFLAVSIGPPTRFEPRLSESAARAVEVATERAVCWIDGQ